MSDLPPISRLKMLQYLQHVKHQNKAGSRGKLLETACKARRDLVYDILAEIVAGTLNEES